MKSNWNTIKNYYTTHNISLEKLAKKFKVSKGAIYEHSTKEQWVMLRDKKLSEINAKVEQKLIEKEINRKVAENEKHIELYDRATRIIEKMLELYQERIETSNVNKIKVSPDALERLISCIEKVQKGQRLALNIGADASEGIKEDEIRIIEGLNENKI